MRGVSGDSLNPHVTRLPWERRRNLAGQLIAWPMGKGSGSVTTFSRADGFITIGRHEEIVAAGARVEVTLLGRDLVPADLVVIGSHCIGLDLLLAEMHRRGWRTKLLAVGSTAGLDAAKRGQCDVAGMHLLRSGDRQIQRAVSSRRSCRSFAAMAGCKALCFALATSVSSAKPLPKPWPLRSLIPLA